MDTEVKPTWRLAWGLWWRQALIGLGVALVIMLILFLVTMSFLGGVIGWIGRLLGG